LSCSPAGRGADTIVLPSNTNVILSAVYAISYLAGPAGLPTISSQITIEGNGTTISRQGDAPDFFLMNAQRDLTLESLTLSGGSGGLFNFGKLSIKKSTISGNSANSGGGIFNYYGIAKIENSTISGNTANYGGGIGNGNYFYGNYWGNGATVSLKNSVIAGNQASVAPEIGNFGIVTANHFNLFGTNGSAGVIGFIPGRNDIVPAAGVQIADLLGPLDNNGGPTQTHASLAGSPAIDAGHPSGCRTEIEALLITDQRGFVRNFDGNHDGFFRCDIGAVESGAEALGPLLVLAASRLLDAEIGVPYTSPSLITGGVQPYSIDFMAGALPPGLIYDPITNTISGTPATFGLKSFRLRITD